MTILGIIIGLAAFFLVAALVEKVKESIDKSYLKRAHNKLLDEYLEHHRVY
jgi:hypothetical protein